MCLILQGTRVQVQVLKPYKFVQKSSEEVMFIKAQQMYPSRFNIWNSTDISTAVSIKNYEIQIFKSDFTHIHVYLCRVSFFTILDIYKIILRAVKGDDTTWCKVIIHLNGDRRQFALVHLSLEGAIAFVR